MHMTPKQLRAKLGKTPGRNRGKKRRGWGDPGLAFYWSNLARHEAKLQEKIQKERRRDKARKG